MDWGDIPAWVAAGFALLAARIARKARKDGKRSADASVRSAAAAEQAAIESRRSADAAHRAADIAAEQLALDQEAARPRVELHIRPLDDVTWRLVNEGEAAARGLRLIEEDLGYVNMDPLPEVFADGASRLIYLKAPANPPDELRFVWAGQEEPVTVSPD